VERGADNPSERYKLYYSHAFGIPPSQFGPGQHDALGSLNQVPGTMLRPLQPQPPGVCGRAFAQGLCHGQADPSPQELAAVAYPGIQESVMGDSAVRQEVLMAAHEGSDRAEEFEQHGIGEATFEQLRADVMRLSGLCDTAPPLAAFLEMRRVRSRIYRLLDRRLWPGEQADLHFLLGCINGLMGVAAYRLGYWDSAEELIRAGYASAVAIGHGRLQGTLRMHLSANMYWRGWFRESRDLAADGLRTLTRGPLAANLQLNHARSSARTGDPDTARQAVELAHAAREDDYSDDLVELGGEEFALSRATHHCMAAHAFTAIGNADADAATELERAISLYSQGPAPGERYCFVGKALASADLALIRLRSGALDGAASALASAFSLPPERRTVEVSSRLGRVRQELAAPLFQRSPQARELGERIEEFDREAVTAGLHSLASGIG